MSPATHHMSSMDPYKTDTDVFQQLQSIDVWKRNMVTVPVICLFLANSNYKKSDYFLSTHIFG